MSIISLFLIIVIVASAAIFYVTEPSKHDKLIDERLNALDQTTVLSEENDKILLRQVTFSRIPVVDKFIRRNRVALYLQKLALQADVDWTVGRMAFGILLCIGVGAFLGNWFIAPGLIGWLPGLALGILPVVVLIQKRNLRFRRFMALLPEAVDLMSRCLRSGQGINAAIEVVAAEIPDPLGAEFGQAADEQNFGLPFRESMLNLVSRIPVADLQFLAIAMLVQKETGGNLVEILEKTSHLLRERLRVKGELRVRTAQGRFAGYVLCALPIAVYFGMNLINPGYGQILFEDPSGRKWMMTAAVLMVLGVLVIRKVVNVKV